MDVILSGEEKNIKSLLNKERLWMKRNNIEVISDDVVKVAEPVEKKVQREKVQKKSVQNEIKDKE